MSKLIEDTILEETIERKKYSLATSNSGYLPVQDFDNTHKNAAERFKHFLINPINRIEKLNYINKFSVGEKIWAFIIIPPHFSGTLIDGEILAIDPADREGKFFYVKYTNLEFNTQTTAWIGPHIHKVI